MRAAAALVSLLFLAPACTSSDEAPVTFGAPPPDVVETPAATEEVSGRGASMVRRIAREIEAEYPLVMVWKAETQQRGRVVVYAVRFRLDDRSDHPEFDDWNAHVRRAARSQREAAVTMLKRTVEELPRVRLVSVYQDELLQPYWSRPQIHAMADPLAYRTFDAWRELVLSAAVLPGRQGP
jgi:hypothetical protein